MGGDEPFMVMYYSLRPLFDCLLAAQAHRYLTLLVHGFCFGTFVWLATSEKNLDLVAKKPR